MYVFDPETDSEQERGRANYTGLSQVAVSEFLYVRHITVIDMISLWLDYVIKQLIM